MCDGIFNDQFITQSLLNPMVKILKKSVNICRSYGLIKYRVVFYETRRSCKRHLMRLFMGDLSLFWGQAQCEKSRTSQGGVIGVSDFCQEATTHRTELVIFLPARRSKRGTCYGNVAGWVTPKWAWPGLRDRISKFWNPPYNF